MSKFRGPVFPSFLTQRQSPPKSQWLPHCSTRQQLRNLRRKVQPIIDSKDPALIALGERCIRSVIHEPNPEFGALHLMSAAMEMHDVTKESWAVCMKYLLDKYDAIERGDEEGAGNAPPA